MICEVEYGYVSYRFKFSVKIRVTFYMGCFTYYRVKSALVIQVQMSPDDPSIFHAIPYSNAMSRGEDKLLADNDSVARDVRVSKYFSFKIGSFRR